jgi:hypothetical protein
MGGWRKAGITEPSLRALIRVYEYEDWPRGRIVYDRSKDHSILYAESKLMVRETIVIIREHFHLPADHTSIEGDFHYQSKGSKGGDNIDISTERRARV